MDIVTDKDSLFGFVKQAKDGKIVLPQFQRNFVWNRADVEDLIVSLLKGYFIGSFLLLRTDKDNSPFAIRPIEGVKKNIEDLNPDRMILDGQQRLTTLHYILYAPDKVTLKNATHSYRFFINLNKLLDEDIENCVFSERKINSKRFLDRNYQFENLIIPLTEVPNWNEWKSEYTQWLSDNDLSKLKIVLKETLPKLELFINNIVQKDIPYIEIPKILENDEKGISEVCAIFEKMNSTGVRLSVYDLLTARLYKYKDYNIDIHSLWEETIEKFDSIKLFSEEKPDEFGIFILRFIALIRNIDIKGKNLINLKPENFKEDWKTASKYIENALKRIVSTNDSGFGVFDKKWQPYPPMVVVMASILYKIDKEKLNSNSFEFLRQWYWISVFTERYNSSVESKTYSDFINLYKKIKDETHSYPVIDDFAREFSTLTFQDVNSRSAKYKGVINLIALENAKDFISGDSIEFNLLDDHHIFPVKYLEKQKNENDKRKYNNSKINMVLNKTLITSTTNRSIKDSAPKKYLEKIEESNLNKIMQSHLIDEKSLFYLKNNDFENFYKNREKVILSMIKDLVGIKTILERNFEVNELKAVNNFETSLRKLINEKMNENYNSNWWKHIPSNIKDAVETRIGKECKRHPDVKKEDFTDSSKKLGLTDLEHLRQIITSQWNTIFKEIVKGSPEEFTADFKNILNLRNKIAHSNVPEEYIKNLGLGSLEKLSLKLNI